MILQAPAGSSLEYTTDIAQKAETIIKTQKEVAAQFSVAGFSFTGASPNQGLMFVRLKDYAERRDPSQSLSAVLGRISGQLFAIPGAFVIAVPPPAIQGLSTFGGFQFELLDKTGGDITNLSNALGMLIGKSLDPSAGPPKVVGLRSSFTANDPQLVVTIDRDKARTLGLPISEITNALQVYVGSTYVNDFDYNNRGVSRVRAGGSAVQSVARRVGEALRAGVERQDDSARRRRAHARDDGAGRHQPLQLVPVRGNHRQSGARAELGTGPAGDGANGA